MTGQSSYSLFLFLFSLIIFHFYSSFSYSLFFMLSISCSFLKFYFHSRTVCPPLSPLSFLLGFLHLLSIDEIGKFNQKNGISFPSLPQYCSTYSLLMKLANSIRKMAFLSLPLCNKLFHLLSIDDIGKFNQKNGISFPSLFQ